MCKNFISTLFLWIVCGFSVFADDDPHPGTRPFQVLLWPGRGSLIHTATSEEWVVKHLYDAWHEGNLLTYTGRTLRIITQAGGSLDKYLRIVLNSRPECIEGDPGLIEREINQSGRLYVPLLQVDWGKNARRPSMIGEILFLEHTESWKGTLGVIHPHYGIGGGIQLAYWKEQQGREPPWIALHSTEEVLRHLFVGSIQAAAVPEGAIDAFLRGHNRLDLLDRIIRVRVPTADSYPVIYLRQDLYENPRIRTLISETWLRDHFSSWLQPAPLTVR